MSFVTSALVRFADVDPAGIVFYPRYFEMLNGAVEDWFARRLGVDFATMHLDRKIGVPTVKLECEFTAPSRLGEQLTITISPRRLGRSSCAIAVDFSCKGEPRLHAEVALVCMDLTSHKACEWPQDLRAAIGEGLVPAA
ncbi:thioesterase [Novosphingobium sp. PC22D]|uniref:acyl-CoA thioesterase n=1 Tax=Novosphingobium sp. PC22D TaxID=1962403 RepID=UPI000BF2091D|nr:thioesterase family protein [Novosphingobium sp. PC22D]PEQ13070.1 thioesterase [Novosphingobium sp. PC22D]